MHHLGVYIRENLPMVREFILVTLDGPFMSFQLSVLHTITCLFFFYRFPSSQACHIVRVLVLQREIFIADYIHNE